MEQDIISYYSCPSCGIDLTGKGALYAADHGCDNHLQEPTDFNLTFEKLEAVIKLLDQRPPKLTPIEPTYSPQFMKALSKLLTEEPELGICIVPDVETTPLKIATLASAPAAERLTAIGRMTSTRKSGGCILICASEEMTSALLLERQSLSTVISITERESRDMLMPGPVRMKYLYGLTRDSSWPFRVRLTNGLNSIRLKHGHLDTRWKEMKNLKRRQQSETH